MKAKHSPAFLAAISFESISYVQRVAAKSKTTANRSLIISQRKQRNEIFLRIVLPIRLLKEARMAVCGKRRMHIVCVRVMFNHDLNAIKTIPDLGISCSRDRVLRNAGSFASV